MSDMGANNSEAQSELADCVTSIAQALIENGHSHDEVAIAM